MKIISSLVALALFSRLGDGDRPKGKYGKDYVYFFDKDNKPHLVSLTTPDIQFKEPVALVKPSDVKFWLYTRRRTTEFEELFIDDTTSDDITYLAGMPLVLLIHGWISNGESDATQWIKNALLLRYDLNVIVVDWRALADTYNYYISACSTKDVGEMVGVMVQTLARRHHIDGSDIHLIGHSLGAHVASYACRSLKKNNLIVGHLTGLDPARPFFELPPLISGISQKDAEFVDIIHTDAGILGIKGDVGHADFFPNDGYHLPECDSLNIFIRDSCRHSMAYVYYAESIVSKKVKCRKCESFKRYKSGKCFRNDFQYMGYECSSAARGQYYGYTKQNNLKQKDKLLKIRNGDLFIHLISPIK